MNPLQLRETTMARKRAAWCSYGGGRRATTATRCSDMLLAKKRAADRRDWLETKGNAEV